MILAMPRPRKPYLHRQVSRHGKVVWYVRRGARGKKHRINGEFGSPEFEAAYEAAVASNPATIERVDPTAKGTLAWLWEQYQTTGAWDGLSAATRGQRENIMAHVLKAAGSKPYSFVNQAAIIDGVERRSATPFQAKNFLTTMRQFFKWAVKAKHVKIDPTLGVTVVRPRTRGFIEWDVDDVLAYEKRWPLGTRERVMLDIYCYTGLRRGDAAAVGKQHVRNGVITIRTEKTGMVVQIPLLPVLARTLDAGPLGDLAWNATRLGAPLAKESLGNFFKEACVAAGIRNKSAHGLRKAAATRAAENGATAHELMAIFGWTDIKEAEIYTRAADRKRLAAGAIAKMDRPADRTEERTSYVPTSLEGGHDAPKSAVKSGS